MKTLFYSAIFCLFTFSSFAQSTIQVINSTCEDKEVRVYFDDATAACTGTPVNCTPIQVITQIVPAGGSFVFSAACGGATLYEVYAQSNFNGSASSWYPSGCRGNYNGQTPIIDPCPGPNMEFAVVPGTPTIYEIFNF